MFELVVRGDIVTSRQIYRGGYLACADGRVVSVGMQDPGPSRERLMREGALVFPGAIDAQVHSRSQKGREGLAAATRAAAAGGVTTVVDMPYDEEALVCDAASVRAKADDVERQAHVDVALYGTIRPSDGVSKIAEQVQAGVCAFKFSTFGTDPVRFPRIPRGLMELAFRAIAPAGLAAGVHNEDDELVRTRSAEVKDLGTTDYTAHGLTHTPLSELLATAEIYEMGAHTGCRAHVVHCSLGRGIEICESYRRQGFQASVEVCIHYLCFDEENDVSRKGGLAKVNPPIRGSADREKLWGHLAAGNVDLVSTDHVAWSLDRKNHPDMLVNASGGPSLEALVPMLLKGCLERGVELTTAARVLAQNPARHFRLQGRKGALTVGADADFSVIDPTPSPWLVARSQTVSDWSLYDGISMPQVQETWLRGTKVWDGEHVLSAPGSGRFVTP